MLTDEQIEVLGETLCPLFEYLEQEVIADVSRRLLKTLTYTRTAELTMQNMLGLGYSPQKIQMEVLRRLRADAKFCKMVEDNTIAYKKDIKKLIEDIVDDAIKTGDEVVAKAGNMSWVDDMSVWQSQGIEISKTRLPALVDAMQRQTGIELLNLSKTLAFKGIRGAEPILNLYTMELNKAMVKISGGFDATTVIRGVVKDLANSGLRSIDFMSGRTMQMDSAVRLALRTGTHQLSGQIQARNIIDTDVSLVYVTEHQNARNKGFGVENHEEWQGKVYSVKLGNYDEEAKRIGQEQITDLYDATGYCIDGTKPNNPLGLYGYNCRHRTHPWFVGVSEKPKRLEPKAPIKWNDRELDGYAQTQEMRRMEYNIRKLKREKEAMRRYGEDTYGISRKIDMRESEYRDFCYRCGVKPSNVRTYYEGGTADITKTEAYKRFKMLK